MTPNDKPPLDLRHRVTLHHICVGTQDEIVDGKQFMTYATILKTLKIEQSPFFMKMDVEGYEWSVIPAIIDSQRHLPTQIAFELHFHTYPETGLEWAPFRYKSPAEIALFMDYLYRHGQYHLIDRRDNQYCRHCSEFLIARVCSEPQHMHTP